MSALRRALPQVECLLADPLLEMRVVAVEERAPVFRFPAETLELPPPRLEAGVPPHNWVLICVHLRRTEGCRCAGVLQVGSRSSSTSVC